jgi:hypothetical protein
MTRRRTSHPIRCWQMLGTAAVVLLGCSIEGAVRVAEWVVGR